MKRKWDRLVGSIGGALALVFIGGLAVTMRRLPAADFQELYQNTLAELFAGLPAAAAQEQLEQLTGYFGLALFFALSCLAAALLLAGRDRFLRLAGLLYGLAGLILLLGTQLLAYPFAFFFFAAGVLAFHRYSLKRKEERMNVSDDH